MMHSDGVASLLHIIHGLRSLQQSSTITIYLPKWLTDHDLSGIDSLQATRKAGELPQLCSSLLYEGATRALSPNSPETSDP